MLNKILEYQKDIEQALKERKYGSNPKELYEPVSYIMTLGGKRLRPVLVLLGCGLFNEPVVNAIHAAIAIELFHNFTLVHDDLMDNAPLRRNQKTVHEKWDSNIAILSGDAMIICAYQELCKIDEAKLLAVMNIFNDTALKVCEGQQMDMNYEKIQKISISHYLKMIELKTAVLLGASLKMGALIGNATKVDADKLYEFGKNLGIAFQLHDDILDVYADTDKFGKQKGGDIIANKKTFLMLKAIEMVEGNRYMKEELHQWINAPHFDNTEKVEAVTHIYNFLNVKELALKEMQKHFDAAMICLEQIDVKPEKKQQLIDFANNLMIREV